MPRPWHTRLRIALPVIGPLAVALIALFVFSKTNDNFNIGLTIAAENGSALGLDAQAENYWRSIAAERRARLLWETSIICLVVTSLAAIGISLWITIVSVAGKARTNVLISLAAVLVPLIFLIWNSDVSLRYTRQEVLEPTIGQALKLTGSSFTLDLFELFRKFTNSISTVATVAVAFAIMAATQLEPAATDKDADFEQRARQVAEQVHRLHILLYVAAAVLITVVLSMTAWLLWPVALADTPDLKTRLTDIALGVGIFWGTSFTLMLAAAYFPSAMRLNDGIRALRSTTDSARSSESSSEQRHPATAHFELNQPVFAQVTRLVAILSPMIASALPLLDFAI